MIRFEPKLSSSSELKRIPSFPKSAFSRLISPVTRITSMVFCHGCISRIDGENREIVGRIAVSDIDKLGLPDELERTDDTIRVAGHRVSLYLILDAYLGGKSIDEIREMYPTIPPNKLWNIIQYIIHHMEIMRNYHADLR